jgi:sugar lactone lactonase YvrE
MIRGLTSRPERFVPAVSLLTVTASFLCTPLISGSSLTGFDVYNTLQGLAQLGLLVLGLGVTMIAGEVDLSVVGTYALGGMLAVQTGQSSAVLGVLAAVARGRAFAGNFGFDLMGGAPLETASLHRVDSDGTVTEVAADLWFPNGSVITPDNVLIVNETFGNRSTAFDVTEDGELANRRVWAEFGPLPTERPIDKALAQTTVAPDGACLDAEGAVWIADATGDRLLRVKEGGKITDEVRPGSPVYACALGGADGRTLFACAAPDFDEAARTAKQEASLIAIRVTVPAAC